MESSFLIAIFMPPSCFRFLINALRIFMSQNEGRVPLEGRVPDLTCLTEYYVQLQEAYQTQAASDRATMKGILSQLLAVLILLLSRPDY